MSRNTKQMKSLYPNACDDTLQGTIWNAMVSLT